MDKIYADSVRTLETSSRRENSSMRVPNPAKWVDSRRFDSLMPNQNSKSRPP